MLDKLATVCDSLQLWRVFANETRNKEITGEVFSFGEVFFCFVFFGHAFILFVLSSFYF